MTCIAEIIIASAVFFLLGLWLGHKDVKQKITIELDDLCDHLSEHEQELKDIHAEFKKDLPWILKRQAD